MTDQNKSPDPKSNPDPDSAARNVAAPKNSPETASQQQDATTNEGPAKEVSRELHRWEKINIAGQLSLVVVGVIAACIYGCQLHTMNGQLDEMKSSSTQTNQLITSAQISAMSSEQNAAAAKNFAQSAKSINTGISEAVDRLGRQAKATQDASIAAQRAATTAANELELSERPWITVEIAVAGPLIFDEHGAYFDYSIKLRNVGHSPAVHVFPNIVLVALKPGELLTTERQKRVDCYRDHPVEMLKFDEAPTGYTLFPGDEPLPEIYRALLSPQELQIGVDALSKFAKPNSKAVDLHLMGCVSYEPNFIPNKRYETGVSFMVGEPLTAVTAGESIPQAKLRFTKEAFQLGNYAY